MQVQHSCLTPRLSVDGWILLTVLAFSRFPLRKNNKNNPDFVKQESNYYMNNSDLRGYHNSISFGRQVVYHPWLIVMSVVYSVWWALSEEHGSTGYIWLPILLLVVSWTGGTIYLPCPRSRLRNCSLARHKFGRPNPRQPARSTRSVWIWCFTHGIPPAFRDGVHINMIYRQPTSGQSRVTFLSKMRTDGVYCRESSGIAPVVLSPQVSLRNGGCLFMFHHQPSFYAPMISFPTPTIIGTESMVTSPMATIIQCGVMEFDYWQSLNFSPLYSGFW